MKQFFKTLLFAAAFATMLTGCSSDNGTDDPIPGPDDPKPEQPTGAPSILWPKHEFNTVYDIEDQMDIVITAKAPAGFKTLSIKIDSRALTADALSEMGLSTDMNLVEPASDAMAKALKDLGLPTGTEVTDNTEVSLDLSKLVPMIKKIYDKPSTHNIKITVKDNKSDQTNRTLQFRLVMPSDIVYNDDFDPWLKKPR